MNPYFFVLNASNAYDSLLSLCCGIGFELAGVTNPNVTAVDASPQYLAEVPMRCPQAKCVNSESLDYLKSQPDKSVDVISIIDGIEHMDKPTGIKVIKQMKRVVRKEILLFTPQGPSKDGYLKNEPHNAWGIEGADHFQTHKSGWTQEELESYGFTLLQAAHDTSQHGEPYKALMMVYRKD